MEPLKSTLNDPFPGNSEKERAQKKLPPKPQLSGETTVKKESPFMTFYHAVFSGTVADVKRSLWNRLVNVTKDTIYNTFVGFLDDYIYNGSARSTNRGLPERTSLTNPDRYWGGQAQKTASRGYGAETIVYRSRRDAEAVLEAMIAYLSDYGNVPVALYLDYSGRISEYTDNNWGWRSLDGAVVRPEGSGFIIALPKPEPLR